MKKIYIWGAGQCFDIVYEAVNRELCVIAGVVDINKSKQGNIIRDEILVESPDTLLDCLFDYILISVRNYEAIVKKCHEMGIDDKKIIAFWKSDESSPYIDYAKVIWDLKKESEKYRCRWENLPYELGINDVLKIRNAEELLHIILERKASLCRFGDGEFELMRGNNRPWFQEINEALAIRLKEVVHSDYQNVIIAIADNFGSLENYTEAAADEIRIYLSNGTRNAVMKLLDSKRTYYDAYVSRPYMMYKDKKHAIEIFRLLKKVWTNRDLLIVEGKYSRIGAQNDLFIDAKSIRRILCPHKNAFSKYNEILNITKESVLQDELVLISLGPTATVLAYDLARCGIQALDIGQIDNEYEWYVREAKERIAIPGKMVAESHNSMHDEYFDDVEYISQIVAEIK